MLATLSQQWARRYTTFIQQPGRSPQKRARFRAFFSDGVARYRFFLGVDALPALLHLSIFLFIVGLTLWLFRISLLVFTSAISLVGFPMTAYLWFTLSPFFRPNSLFYSPLSPTIWWLYYGLLYIIFKVLSSFCASRRFDTLRNDYHVRLADGIGGTADKFTWQLSSGADTRILVSMLDALEEDGARSRFFEAIPGFFNSKQVNNIQGHSLEKFRIKFRPVLNGFIDRALSSNLVSEWVKSSQVIICLNATFEVLGPDGVTEILHRILDGRWQVFLQSVEMANSLRRWAVVVTTNLLI